MSLKKILVFAAAILCFTVSGAFAQEQGELVLRLSRNWGYASGTGKIQGLFTLKASGPASLQRVVFYLDNMTLGEDSESPFELRLNTDDYSLGEHTLYAIGKAADGSELRSNEVRVFFVSSEEGWQAGARILIPMLAIIFGGMLLSYGLMFLGARRLKRLPPGTPRQYGLFGGAICPNCGRPFSLHLFGLNLGFSKFDRCPYCGKWSKVRSRPTSELRAAEAAELQGAHTAGLANEMDEQEELRRQLDDSRYQDL